MIIIQKFIHLRSTYCVLDNSQDPCHYETWSIREENEV